MFIHTTTKFELNQDEVRGAVEQALKAKYGFAVALTSFSFNQVFPPRDEPGISYPDVVGVYGEFKMIEKECPFCIGRTGRIVSTCEDCCGSGKVKVE